MQLLVILARLHAERIEIRMQMAAHAIGADHHQGMDGIARGADEIRIRKPGAPLAAAASDLPLSLSETTFSTAPQLPSSAEISSPLTCGGSSCAPRRGRGLFFAREAFEIGRVAGRKRREINSAFVVHGSIPFSVDNEEFGALGETERAAPRHRRPDSSCRLEHVMPAIGEGGFQFTLKAQQHMAPFRTNGPKHSPACIPPCARGSGSPPPEMSVRQSASPASAECVSRGCRSSRSCRRDIRHAHGITCP